MLSIVASFPNLYSLIKNQDSPIVNQANLDLKIKTGRRKSLQWSGSYNPKGP